jgi:hypothetical protein
MADTDLDEAVRRLPFFDHHAHLLAQPTAGYSLAEVLTESPGSVPQTPHLLTWLRAQRDLVNGPVTARGLLDGCRFEAMLVDDGYRFPGGRRRISTMAADEEQARGARAGLVVSGGGPRRAANRPPPTPGAHRHRRPRPLAAPGRPHTAGAAAERSPQRIDSDGRAPRMLSSYESRVYDNPASLVASRRCVHHARTHEQMAISKTRPRSGQRDGAATARSAAPVLHWGGHRVTEVNQQAREASLRSRLGRARPT